MNIIVENQLSKWTKLEGGCLKNIEINRFNLTKGKERMLKLLKSGVEEHHYKHWEIKKIVKECYEQLYTNKLYNLVEIYKILERHKLSKLTQEEIEHLNIPVTLKLLDY